LRLVYCACISMSIDAHEIIPNLWQGGYPPLGGEVGRAGFNLLVLCAIEYQYGASSFDWVPVVNAPNEDRSDPITREELSGAIAAGRKAAEAVRRGERVLVTCAAGLNRSGLVTGIALHMITGWNGATCIKQIREKRTVKRRDGLIPLCNPSFAEVLQNLPFRWVAAGTESPEGIVAVESDC
jgi:hypothetical protein